MQSNCVQHKTANSVRIEINIDVKIYEMQLLQSETPTQFSYEPFIVHLIKPSF